MNKTHKRTQEKRGRGSGRGIGGERERDRSSSEQGERAPGEGQQVESLSMGVLEEHFSRMKGVAACAGWCFVKRTQVRVIWEEGMSPSDWPIGKSVGAFS